MLKGIEISLDAQAQFFAMFDGKTYLGFTIIGAKWRIRWGAKWVVPSSATELERELSQIKTHSSSLRDVVAILNHRGSMVDEKDIDTGVKLAGFLATVLWDGEEKEVRAEQKRLETIIGRLDFGTKKVGFAYETLTEALRAMSPTVDISLQHVSFPSAQEYVLFKDRHAIVLSRFGYKIPSFDIYKGQEAVLVNKPELALGAAEDTGKVALAAIKQVMVAEKPFSAAVKDFAAFMKEPKIFQFSGQRSGIHKHNAFKAARKDMIVQILAAMVKDVVVPVKASEKKKQDNVFVEEDFLRDLLAVAPVPSVLSRAGSVA
jgi:hypothetical protein